MWYSAALLFRNNSCIYLKQLSAQTWGIVSILQEASGCRRRGAGSKKNKGFIYEGPNAVVPAQPLTKQHSQSIVPVTNSYIHIDTLGNKTPKEGGGRGKEPLTWRWRSASLFHVLFFGGVGNQSLPSVLTAANWFATSSPAAWPVKSTHDVSLSQLWVEIHRINSFVRETHAWEFTVHCQACSRAGPAHPATGHGKARQYP